VSPAQITQYSNPGIQVSVGLQFMQYIDQARRISTLSIGVGDAAGFEMLSLDCELAPGNDESLAVGPPSV